MKNLKRLAVLSMCAILLVSALTGCSGKKKEEFPSQSIRVIVPFAAGGNTDLNARSIADIVQSNSYLSQPMAVTNINGSNSMEGLTALTTSDADGHSIICQNTSYMLAGNAMGTVSINYGDMAPIIEVSTQPCAITVSADSQFQNIDDVIAYATEHPGELTIAYVGAGSTTHLAAEIFLEKTGLKDKLKSVSYTSGADALTAQLRGHGDLRASTAVDCARYIDSGDLRGIAVTADSEVIDAPSFMDLGYDVEFMIRQGYFAPKGTPQEVIDVLYEAIDKACATEEYAQFCKDNAMNPSNLNATDWVAKLDEDMAYMEQIIAGIK